MTDLQLLRDELDRLAATGVQRQRFEEDPAKARAAIAKALTAGAKQPLSYALSVFNSAGFSPTKPAADTNRSVIVNCKTCNGDRVVVFSERAAPNGVYEEMAPCPDCNANANTVRVGFASPSNDRVRERLARQ